MTTLDVVSVTEDNICDLDHGLRALSLELGDAHVADIDTLRLAFLTDRPAFSARLAYLLDEVVGAIVWSAQFSTSRGGGGLYVSDLWVVQSARSQGVGRKLLARAIADAQNSSGACFLKLSVHHTNPAARAYYSHIGFQKETDMLTMTLDGTALQTLKTA